MWHECFEMVENDQATILILALLIDVVTLSDSSIKKKERMKSEKIPKA